MAEEEKQKAKGLNDKEKRLLHIANLETLEERVYNKSHLNDNHTEFSFLTEKENYRPKGQKRRWLFMYPLYSKSGDWSDKVGGKAWALRIIGFFLLMKAGFHFGEWDGKV